MKRIANNIILVILLLVLWLPFIECQFHFPLIKDFTLYGINYTVQQPKLTLKSFSDMSFQNDMDVHAKEHIGYKDFLIRLNNQLDYSLFGLLQAGVVYGKEGNLFGTDYLIEYLGKECLTESEWIDRAKRLRKFQDTMERKNVTVLYCIAPGKASFAADKIPDKYLSEKRAINNYQLISTQLTASGCNLINFHAWYDTLKKTPGEAIFPRNGTHWSVYGSSYALDSLIRYMAVKKGYKMRHYIKRPGPKVKPDKWLDTDLRDMTNLLFQFPVDFVSYPDYVFSPTDSGTYDKPRILFISDSYMVPIEYCTDLYQLFDRSSRVWDYCTKEYALDQNATGQPINAADIENFDFVIIMNTEKNHNKFDFGIMDSYYKAKSKS